MDWLQQYPTSFFTNKRSNKQNWEHQWNLAVSPRDKSYQSFPKQTGFCFHDPNPIVGENFHNPEDLAKCFCWVGCHLCLLPNVFFGTTKTRNTNKKGGYPQKPERSIRPQFLVTHKFGGGGRIWERVLILESCFLEIHFTHKFTCREPATKLFPWPQKVVWRNHMHGSIPRHLNTCWEGIWTPKNIPKTPSREAFGCPGYRHKRQVSSKSWKVLGKVSAYGYTKHVATARATGGSLRQKVLSYGSVLQTRSATTTTTTPAPKKNAMRGGSSCQPKTNTHVYEENFSSKALEKKGLVESAANC